MRSPSPARALAVPAGNEGGETRSRHHKVTCYCTALQGKAGAFGVGKGGRREEEKKLDPTREEEKKLDPSREEEKKLDPSNERTTKRDRKRI